MKIFYFLFLTISINCLSPALLNSPEFLKQKNKLIKEVKAKIPVSKLSFNGTLIEKFDFSGDAVLDFVPAVNFEQEIKKLSLSNDVKQLIISRIKNLNTNVTYNYGVNIGTNHSKVNISLDLVISTKFNTTQGSFIGFAYLKGTTIAHLKDLYDIIQTKKCKNIWPFRKCYYENFKVKKTFTARDLTDICNDVNGYNYSELIKLIFEKWLN